MVDLREGLREDIKNVYNQLPKDIQEEYEYEMLNLKLWKQDALERIFEELCCYIKEGE